VVEAAVRLRSHSLRGPRRLRRPVPGGSGELVRVWVGARSVGRWLQGSHRGSAGQRWPVNRSAARRRWPATSGWAGRPGHARGGGPSTEHRGEDVDRSPPPGPALAAGVPPPCGRAAV